MKLSNMQFNPIHCILYLQDNRVMKAHNEERIQEVMNNLSGDSYVLIYNPNNDLRQEILAVLDNGFDGNEKITLDGLRTLQLIEKLTNIDLGLETGELTLDEALEIVNNPNPMLVAVNQVVNNIFMNILSEQFEIINNISQLPDEVKRTIFDDLVNKEKREQEAKKQAEMDELLKQQKELEDKLKLLRGE